MATATAALLTALSQAATWVGSTIASGASAIGSLAGGAGAAGSTAAAAGTAASAATGLTPELLIASGIDTTALGAAAGGTAAEAATAAGGGLFTASNLATAAAVGSAGAGIIQATKGMPDVAKPPPPPNAPTLADARLGGVSLDAQQRAAAAAGAVAGFSNTVKNTGGARGIDLGTAGRGRLAKASLF